MRQFLISALLLSLLAGCSSVNIGPHRIDVQQGNALDQENVARLKPGLNRSQVRFLLGTPLVVDPFRTDRWDYVYVYYKAGKLAEQKHITLFFEGDTLARIEGDLPQPVVQPAEPQPAPAMPAAPATAEPAAAVSPQPERVEVMAAPAVTVAPATEAPATVTVAPAPVATPPVAAPTVAAAASVAPTSPAPAAMAESSVVAPLPSPKNAPAYVDPRPAAALSLQPETNVEQIRPDVIPSFPETPTAAESDAPVLQSVNEWAAAWSRRDTAVYFSAYDAHFVPPDGRSRDDWEKRKRQAMAAAKDIEVRIESPSVDHAEEGTATVTFKQFYRAGSYHDAVLKQLLMVEHDGRWLIAEEKVLSTLDGSRP
jgi:outer membrane protein assembly factor BamE